IVMICLLPAYPANAKTLVFLGGVNDSTPYIIQSGATQNVTMGFGGQGGLALRLSVPSLLDKFFFELGAQYSIRNYSITTTGYQYTFVEVPVIAKFTLGKTFE